MGFRQYPRIVDKLPQQGLNNLSTTYPQFVENYISPSFLLRVKTQI
ncbi:hypothetical protein EV146_10811 [Mesobacillus foraminis]|uniref:Uncharacterized protein n=1 Tax=Mesobacillus foraminis TaxID=279826 RepID=A0A4R2BCC6_9BACI|nr:hypothetical protein EV146_10811 [Mesobacillus foraminis]